MDKLLDSLDVEECPQKSVFHEASKAEADGLVLA